MNPTPPPFYYLIAYKPNSVDSVMGCVQDRFNSDFESHGPLTEEKLLTQLTAKLNQNRNSAYGEADYRFQILRNGVLVYDDIDSYAREGYQSFYYDTTPQEEQTDENDNRAEVVDFMLREEMTAIMNQARERSLAEHKAELLRKKEQEAAQKQRAQEARDKADFERFQELQQKFGNAAPEAK